jgi:hypothetical protein
MHFPYTITWRQEVMEQIWSFSTTFSTIFWSQGTFRDGRYVTTLMTVDFHLKTLSKIVFVLYMTHHFTTL